MPITIRPAAPDDIPEILALIRELAEYEREPGSAVATAEDLMRDGFTEPKRFHCLMAEAGGNIAGFALYFYNYSTWRGHAGIYLEDLFVRPAHTLALPGGEVTRHEGYSLSRWTGGGLEYWAVSDIDPADLKLFRQVYVSRATP